MFWPWKKKWQVVDVSKNPPVVVKEFRDEEEANEFKADADYVSKTHDLKRIYVVRRCYED